MPLLVTFDILTITEFLGLLKAHRCTGHLHVRTGGLSAHLFLEGGWLVGVDLGDRLGGGLDGSMDAVLEACCEMLDSDQGVAEFAVATVHGAGEVRIDPEVLLESARARLAEWREIRAVMPSLDFKPRLVEVLPGGTVTLDQSRWDLMMAIDGRRTLASIARALGLTPYELRRRMKWLVDDRMIELEPVLPTVPFNAESARLEKAPTSDGDQPGQPDAQEAAGQADPTGKRRRRRWAKHAADDESQSAGDRR
jgi:Domain of unknown function (DUF4388)